MCSDVHNQLPHPVAPLRLYKMDWMNYCTSEKSTRWESQSSSRLMQLGDVQHTCSAVGCEIDSRAEGDRPRAVVMLIAPEDVDCFGRWWR